MFDSVKSFDPMKNVAEWITSTLFDLQDVEDVTVVI